MSDRGKRRDMDRRKARSRKRMLENVVGESEWLEEQPIGRFDNNSISNQYASYGHPRKTNRKKGHSNYRSKGAYGVAMDWKPHDRRQLDRDEDGIEEQDEEE